MVSSASRGGSGELQNGQKAFSPRLNGSRRRFASSLALQVRQVKFQGFAIGPNMPCPAKAATPISACLIQTDPLPKSGWWGPFELWRLVGRPCHALCEEVVMAAARHQSATRSLFIAVFAVLFFILTYTFSQVFGNAVADKTVAWIGGILGQSPETVAAVIGTYVVPAFTAGMCLWAAFLIARWHLLQTEFVEDPALPALNLSSMTVTEIAEYLRDQSVWGWRTYARLNIKNFVQDGVPGEMRRAAQSHEVRFIGTPPNTARAVEIDMSYWQYSFFDRNRIWDERNNFFTEVSYSHPLIPGVANYQFGRAPRIDVMRTWPRASLVRKLWALTWVATKKRWWWLKAKVTR